MATVYLMDEDILRALLYLSKSIKCLEEMRISVGESEYFKIGFADENTGPYVTMACIFLKLECNEMALNI